MLPTDILKQYIMLHNYGVETANFEPLIALFAPDAIIDIEEPPLGVFEGRVMIRGIFRTKPPDFMLGVGNLDENKNLVMGKYYDLKRPDIVLGSMSLETDGEKITRVIIR